MLDACITGLIALTTSIRDDDREIGQYYRAGDEHPTGPAGDEDGQDHAGSTDPHGDQVPTGSTGLLDAQPALGLGNREDVTYFFSHDPPPRPMPYPPTQAMALGHILLGEPRVVGHG